MNARAATERTVGACMLWRAGLPPWPAVAPGGPARDSLLLPSWIARLFLSARGAVRTRRPGRSWPRLVVPAIAVLAGATAAVAQPARYEWRTPDAGHAAVGATPDTTPSLMVARMPFESPASRHRVALGIAGESYSGDTRSEFRLAGELDGEMSLLSSRLALGISARADLHTFADRESLWTTGGFRGLSFGLKVTALDDNRGSGLALGGRLSLLNTQDSGVQTDAYGASVGVVGTLALGSVHFAKMFAYSYGWSTATADTVHQIAWASQTSYALSASHHLAWAFSGVLSLDQTGYTHRSDVGLGYECVLPSDDSLVRFGAMGVVPLTYGDGFRNVGFLLKVSWEG